METALGIIGVFAIITAIYWLIGLEPFDSDDDNGFW